jgi:threonine/homoserine/homoserine lactone efflux protein
MHALLAFGGTALILTMVPGLDTAMVIRTAAVESRRHGMFAAIGIGLGCLCWGSVVAFGLGAVLAASEFGFAILRWAGAGYLLWLGFGLLLRREPTPIVTDEQPKRTAAKSLGNALKRGFTTNILNPKVGLFYLTLLPQFVPAGAPAAFSLLLASVHVALAVVWFMVLAMGIGAIAPVLRRPTVMRGLDLSTGCVFVGFAAHIMLAAHA